MKARLILVVLPLVVFITAAAIAADNEKAPSKLRELDYLGGTWQCKGTAFAFGDQPKHDVVATTKGTWILNDMWLEIRYVELKTKANPHPFNVRGFFGYDPEQKKLALGSIENDGGYSTESSNGWEGDAIVFTGPNHMGGMTVTGRDTWTKKSKTKLTYSFEIEDKGNWTKLIEETCTR
jgi:hypothetical protein